MSWRTWSDQEEPTSLRISKRTRECVQNSIAHSVLRSSIDDVSALRSILRTFAQEQPPDPHCEWAQRRQFLKHALAGPFKGRVAWRHDIGVQILADVNVAYHYARKKKKKKLWIPLRRLEVWSQQLRQSIAYLSARVSACTARLKNRLPAVQVFTPPLQHRVRQISLQRAVTSQGQARRAGGHALGAKYTAFSMNPSNGMYRVRRRRFEEARSDSIIPLEAPAMQSPSSAWNIATLSVSLSMFSI